jgi:polar amino acid transport system substrate-binding protein
MFKKTFIIVTMLSSMFLYAGSKTPDAAKNIDHSTDVEKKKEATKPREFWMGGWYDWNPYQYLKNKDDPNSLTGLDVAFSKLVMQKLGKRFEITDVSWKQHQDDIKSGKRQFAMGAFYSDDRAKYAYISKPYRDEENSFFVLKSNEQKHKYSDAAGFLDYIKKNKLRVGMIEGYKFADDKLNVFVSDPANKDLIVFSKTDIENMNLTLSGSIDGFLGDRIVGATTIWKEGISNKFSEKYLNVKAPIRILLSKETVTEEEAKMVDKAIDEVKSSDEFAKLVNWYFYPVILMQTADTYWFFFLELAGMVAFAISGLILASRINTSILGAFLLAFIPSVGGGIIRDITFGRYPIWIVQNKSYMMMLMFIVVTGFIFMKIQQRFFNGGSKKLHSFSDHAIVIADAAGLAVFTVVGVIVSMLVKTDPLWFWGPFIALLTGAGGGMLRDLIIKTRKVGIIYGEIYGELAVVWGAVLSIYLTLTVDDTRPERIQYAVVFCVIGCFISRLIIYYFKFQNIIFGKEESDK